MPCLPVCRTQHSFQDSDVFPRSKRFTEVLGPQHCLSLCCPLEAARRTSGREELTFLVISVGSAAVGVFHVALAHLKMICFAFVQQEARPTVAEMWLLSQGPVPILCSNSLRVFQDLQWTEALYRYSKDASFFGRWRGGSMLPVLEQGHRVFRRPGQTHVHPASTFLLLTFD